MGKRPIGRHTSSLMILLMFILLVAVLNLPVMPVANSQIPNPDGIDLSAEATIAPAVMPCQLQVYNDQYTFAGVTYEQPYSIHVQRIDNNTNVGFVHAIIDLRRQNQSDASDFVIANDNQTSDIFTLLPIDEHTFNTTWTETSTAEVGKWTMAGYVTAISGNAYDSNLTNNAATDGSFDARALTGDIDGSSEVDIFDAIALSGAFGVRVGEPRWNPNADINGDNLVDIFDAILMAGGFGDTIEAPFVEGHYTPSGYTLLGNTTFVGGELSNLMSNDANYMTFRSNLTGNFSTQYVHNETTTLGSGPETGIYLNIELDPADGAGWSITRPATQDRVLIERSVYPLTNLTWIPSGNWTMYYRTRLAGVLPTAIARCNVDILIRQSNGTVRETIATKVANSSEITDTWLTLSGLYSFPGYSVVNRTDYLEVDIYAAIENAPATGEIQLRIDDSTLLPENQTRMDSTIPTTWTAEVEFTGSILTGYPWNTRPRFLVWSVDSGWSTYFVYVEIQLYNYSLGDYATSGNGYMNYVTLADVDQTITNTITNVEDFYDANGNWRIKIKGLVEYPHPPPHYKQFDLRVDWVNMTVKAPAPCP